jgi:hypothetical protein
LTEPSVTVIGVAAARAPHALGNVTEMTVPWV